MKKISTSSVLLWAAVLVAGAYFVYARAPGLFEKALDPRSQEALQKVAAAINQSVPVMIDAETELLPVAGAPGMLIYNYRLVGYSAAQVDRDKFAAGAKQRINESVCSRPETRDDFLKKGVTLRYSYYDKDKQPIATVDVTPADCGF